mgnify:CR=1 FL=1|jgi:rubredoxin/uncharacterized Fe-S cluster protein YjdI
MTRYRCRVCGYIYDPAKGVLPDASPNTPFEALDDTWKCPICGVGKDEFEPIEDPAPIIKYYSNQEITVIWQPDLCNHNGNCWKSLGQVFDPSKRPWVDMEGADTESIIRVVNECPTGALTWKSLNN